MRRLASTLPLAVALVCGAAGCGGKDKPIPVEGVVLLDDQPLAGATVTFAPLAEEGVPATGRTGQDGKFTLATGDGRSGALPGEYKVMVSKAEAMELPGGQAPKSPEEIEQMMMKGRGKDRHTPQQKKRTADPLARYRSDNTPLRQTVPATGKVVLKLESKGR